MLEDWFHRLTLIRDLACGSVSGKCFPVTISDYLIAAPNLRLIQIINVNNVAAFFPLHSSCRPDGPHLENRGRKGFPLSQLNDVLLATPCEPLLVTLTPVRQNTAANKYNHDEWIHLVRVP